MPITQEHFVAFEVLVRQHHRRLLAYATSITGSEEAAQDVVQDAFVAAFEKLAQFDASKDFGAWMRGIVRNKCRQWARSRRDVAVEDEVLEVLETQHRLWDAHQTESDEALFSALSRCLKKLPGLLGQAVDLFYMRRLSGAEIAARVGADEAAVRKRLQRARTQLGDCINASLRTRTI